MDARAYGDWKKGERLGGWEADRNMKGEKIYVDWKADWENKRLNEWKKQ